jgi:hypothetical protein
LSEAPQAEPHAAGFSAGLSAAPQAAGASTGLSDAPQAEPQAAGFSAGLSAAPQAAGFSAGLSAAPQAVPQEAAGAAFSFFFQPNKFESAICNVLHLKLGIHWAKAPFVILLYIDFCVSQVRTFLWGSYFFVTIGCYLAFRGMLHYN